MHEYTISASRKPISQTPYAAIPFPLDFLILAILTTISANPYFDITIIRADAQAPTKIQ